ncbi:MAG TPA: VOC family protein [Thermoanaerobaculaceae bacterium]|nr:VOC family protein [Thermoanaerobaculaceae bacterium]
MAIIGMHALDYSKKAEEVRRIFGETLGWRSVDAGEGWLIFAAPPAELAVHPTDGEEHHELYLMCDDIQATVAELKAKGVATTGPVVDRGWGLGTALRLPSGAELGLYEPRHPTPIAAAGARTRTRRKPRTA